MNGSSYTIGNYRPADFSDYVQLFIEVEKLEPAGHFASPQVLKESLYRPNHSPEQDLFLVKKAERVVGYLDATPEVKIGRVVLNCLIHPAHRRLGLASKLFNYAMHRAKALGVTVAHVNIPQDNEIAKGVLSRLGFRYVRCFLELKLDISRLFWPDINQAGLQYRHLRRGEEDKLVQIQNRSFSGTWGFNPNTMAEIVYQISLSGHSNEDVVLAYDGDRIAGYCWTKIRYQMPTHEKTGQIFMLGVDPDYRGRGIGRQVLLAGLAYLKSKGLKVVKVTVDSENKVAFVLYRSIGFEIETSSLWYEKDVR